MTQEFLSPEGHRRRVAMRKTLEGAVVRRHRRKKAVRVGAVAALLVVAGWLAWPMEQFEAPRPDDVVEGPAPLYKSFDFEVVNDEGAILLLEEAGHASGLLRVDGRVVLTRPLDDAGEAD